MLTRRRGKDSEKTIRSMLVDMESGKSFTKGVFKTTPTNRKTKRYTITTTMYKIEDNTDIGMSFM